MLPEWCEVFQWIAFIPSVEAFIPIIHTQHKFRASVVGIQSFSFIYVFPISFQYLSATTPRHLHSSTSAMSISHVKALIRQGFFIVFKYKLHIICFRFDIFCRLSIPMISLLCLKSKDAGVVKIIQCKWEDDRRFHITTEGVMRAITEECAWQYQPRLHSTFCINNPLAESKYHLLHQFSDHLTNLHQIFFLRSESFP